MQADNARSCQRESRSEWWHRELACCPFNYCNGGLRRSCRMTKSLANKSTRRTGKASGIVAVGGRGGKVQSQDFEFTERALRGVSGAGIRKLLSLIHISEPTRLLSISYAVFCLKKKKKK